jgi:hypothetical protein
MKAVTAHMETVDRATDIHSSSPPAGRFVPLSIATVPSATPVAHVRLIPEVCRQLGFQRTLDDPFGQLSEQAMLPENIFRVSIIFEEFI